MKRILLALAIAIALTTIPAMNRSVTAGPQPQPGKAPQHARPHGALLPPRSATFQNDSMFIDDPNFCYEGWSSSNRNISLGGHCGISEFTQSCVTTGISVCYATEWCYVNGRYIETSITSCGGVW